MFRSVTAGAVLAALAFVLSLPALGQPDAVSAAYRRAITLQPAVHQATLTDLDTRLTRTVTTGLNPSRVVLVEKTGHAYVIGKGPAIAGGSGTITDIDLRSGLSRTYPVLGFTPEGAAADSTGTRLYVIGTVLQPASEWMPGVVQVFDTVTRSMRGDPVPVGRMPRQIVAGSLDEIHVLSHQDAPADGRKRALQPVVFTLEATTLSPRRTTALQEARGNDAAGPLFVGRAELDGTGSRLYVLDTLHERLGVMNTATGQLRSVELEGPAQALEIGGRNLFVAFNTLGYTGVFSLDGQRLDTVPLARPGDHLGGYAEATVAVVNYTDVWVDGARPGSGVFIDQQGATIFATLFTHDPHGHPAWLFMSNGVRQPDGSFAGDLYRTKGPLAEAPRNAVAVGSMRFVPGRGDSGSLIYYVDGMLHTSTVQRFRFGDGSRECRWKVNADKALTERTNFTALWSNPADPGWGVALSQLGDHAFALFFTYDDNNRATWLVMSNGRRNAQGGFTGDVYRAVAGRIENAGTMSLAFSNADSGSVRYRIGGLDFQAPILRNTFARLTTRCAS